MKRRALFLDRDGTLVHAMHYPSRPEHLRLFEDIGPELYTLQEMGFSLVVITNQSGIARGYFSEEDLRCMHEHLADQLAEHAVHLDGIYHCPHHPDGAIAELAIRCACRKPQSGMLLRAADELDLDLQHSWFVGDILDDIEAGKRVGCRTVLVDRGTEGLPANARRWPTFVAKNTHHALCIILTVESLSPALDLTYSPPTWQYSDESMEASICNMSS